MNGARHAATRAVAVGTLLLTLAGCAGSGPATDNTSSDGAPSPRPAPEKYPVDPQPSLPTTVGSTPEVATAVTAPTPTAPGVTTTTSEPTTTASPPNPETAVLELDPSEIDELLLDLDGLLDDLDAVLGDLDSSLAQQEGEILND